MGSNGKFACDVTQGERGAVIALGGEIDLTACDVLTQVFNDATDGSLSVVVDTSEVSFMDSSGLRCLLQLRLKCDSKHRNLRLRTPSGAVRKLLDVSGVERFFSIED